MFTVHLAKETFKFSCSHFTIFSALSAERLHGHNYQMKLDLEVDTLDPKLGFAFDFNVVKPMIRAFCDSLDERILLPGRSPFLKIAERGAQVEVNFADKKYSFPKEDTLNLPLVNITSEELARYAGESLSANLKNVPGWEILLVSVEETHGQSVTFRLPR